MVDVIPLLKTRTRRLCKPETERLRSEPHRRFVASLKCCVCGGIDVQAAHLAFAQLRARGLKAGDQFCVPLCLRHHAAFDDGGGAAWWDRLGIAPLPIARRLWCASVAIGRARDPDLTMSEAAQEAGHWEEWVRRGFRERRAA